MIYLKNPETGEIQTFSNINHIGIGYQGWVDITGTSEVEAFQIKQLLEGMNYEVETTTESSTGKTLSSSGGNEITLEYALILNQQVGMIEKAKAIRDELFKEGKVDVTLSSGERWVVRIDKDTRDELVQRFLQIQGTNNKKPFRNWIDEFTETLVGELDIKSYIPIAGSVVDKIHSIFRDIAKKIEALKTQEDIDNFPLQEELARLTSLREGLGVGVKRTVPNYEVTNEREMKLS
jgi:hypothetical protein